METLAHELWHAQESELQHYNGESAANLPMWDSNTEMAKHMAQMMLAECAGGKGADGVNTCGCKRHPKEPETGWIPPDDGGGGIPTPPLVAIKGTITSGTTGAPKAAMLRHRNLLTVAEQTMQGFGIGSDAVFLNVRPLWPIARAVADVLIHEENRSLLRECADDTCAWLFVDRTKNHSRRWCDMNTCGTRNKMREYRERQKRVARRAR